MLPDLDYNEEARKLWSRLGDGPVMKPFLNVLALISLVVFWWFPSDKLITQYPTEGDKPNSGV